VRISVERSSLVIVGAWNQAIFSPQWVAENVMAGPAVTRAEVNITPAGHVPRYMGSEYELFVHPDRLVWRPLNQADTALTAIESSAERVLGRLGETPVSGIGRNIGLHAQEEEGSLAQLLALADSRALEANRWQQLTTAVKRRISRDDVLLNLTIEKHGGIVTLDLNFHRDLAGVADALRDLPGAFVRAKHEALKFLGRVYGLEETA
jgi:hypothetical protein